MIPLIQRFPKCPSWHRHGAPYCLKCHNLGLCEILHDPRCQCHHWEVPCRGAMTLDNMFENHWINGMIQNPATRMATYQSYSNKCLKNFIQRQAFNIRKYKGSTKDVCTHFMCRIYNAFYVQNMNSTQGYRNRPAWALWSWTPVAERLFFRDKKTWVTYASKETERDKGISLWFVAQSLWLSFLDFPFAAAPQ